MIPFLNTSTILPMNIQFVTHQNQSSIKIARSYSSGLELLRVLSAYGVLFIHGIAGIPKNSYASLLAQSFSSFCVPFFLVLSFYLTLKSLENRPVSHKQFLISRLKRIGLPFFSWSLVYISLRFFKSTFVTPGDDSFAKIISDPIGLLSGSAGVQLYFLPMLFVGLLFSLSLSRQLKHLKIWHLTLLFIISSILDIYIQDIRNSFSLDALLLAHNMPIVRFTFNFLNMLTRCIPYVAIAALLIKTEKRHVDLYSRFNSLHYRLTFAAIVVAFLCLPATASSFILHICVFILPTLLLILGLFSSNQKLFGIEKMGSFTFGIYLVHGIFTDGFSALIPKIYPSLTSMNLPTSLLIALFIFLLSLAITYSLSKFRLTSFLFLGNSPTT
jgi:hypothetical protein